MQGTSTGGAGVHGASSSGGTGVVAASLDGTGLALDAQGPAKFLVSGLASVAAGKKSVTLTKVSLRTGSLVLATVQNNAGVAVQYVTLNVKGAKIVINLDVAVPSGKTANVAWFVVN